MKAVTLKPYKNAEPALQKKGNVEGYVVRYKRTDGLWGDSFQTITLVKVGRRVHFSVEQDTDATKIEYANIALGIKTAAKAFQDALDGEVVSLTGVNSFGNYGNVFALQRTGQRIAFVAPCGARGYLTVSEAEKVVAALRSL